METRGRRARGRPRRAGSEGVGPEAQGEEIPIPQGQNRTEFDARTIIEAYERGRAAERERAGPAAPQDHEAEEFRRIFDSFGRLAPSKFRGDGIEAAEEWLADVKGKLRVCRAPEASQVELATHYLENSARFWWENTKVEYEEDPDKIPWAWFEEKFRDEYIGVVQQEALRQKFVSLKQGSKSVAEYNKEFIDLSRYAPDIRGNAYRYGRQYISGLRPKIAIVVDNPNACEVREFMRHAVQVEAHQQNEREQIQERNVCQKTERGQSFNRGKEKATSSFYRPAIRVWCRKCKQPHAEENCRATTQACFSCGGVGHWKRDCPRLMQSGWSSGRGSGSYAWSRDRGGSRNGGRGGNQNGGRGGGRTGVDAVQLEHVESKNSRNEAERPSVASRDELLSGTMR